MPFLKTKQNKKTKVIAKPTYCYEEKAIKKQLLSFQLIGQLKRYLWNAFQFGDLEKLIKSTTAICDERLICKGSGQTEAYNRNENT